MEDTNQDTRQPTQPTGIEQPLSSQDISQPPQEPAPQAFIPPKSGLSKRNIYIVIAIVIAILIVSYITVPGLLKAPSHAPNITTTLYSTTTANGTTTANITTTARSICNGTIMSNGQCINSSDEVSGVFLASHQLDFTYAQVGNTAQYNVTFFAVPLNMGITNQTLIDFPHSITQGQIAARNVSNITIYDNNSVTYHFPSNLTEGFIGDIWISYGNSSTVANMSYRQLAQVNAYPR